MRDAVNKSRVTITVISKHFLASDFCKAEMRFALMKGTDTHSKCLIPVLIDDCDVPLELKEYTYISVNEPNFLNKLYRDLGVCICVITWGYIYIIIYIYIYICIYIYIYICI